MPQNRLKIAEHHVRSIGPAAIQGRGAKMCKLQDVDIQDVKLNNLLLSYY